MIYAATGDSLAATVSTLSAMMPDVVHFVLPKSKKVASHWPVPYIILMALSFVYWQQTQNFIIYYFIYFFMGPCLHLLLDALTSEGIPIFSPLNPKRFAIAKEGKAEFIFALQIIILCAFIAYLKGTFAPEYIQGEIARMKIFTIYFILKLNT